MKYLVLKYSIISPQFTGAGQHCFELVVLIATHQNYFSWGDLINILLRKPLIKGLFQQLEHNAIKFKLV